MSAHHSAPSAHHSASSAHHSASSPPPHSASLDPATMIGYVDTTLDALLIMQACLPGGPLASRIVQERLDERQRDAITSGSIFVFYSSENLSARKPVSTPGSHSPTFPAPLSTTEGDAPEKGIKRWTDGKHWSPSRIEGNFLVYCQLESRMERNLGVRKTRPRRHRKHPPKCEQPSAQDALSPLDALIGSASAASASSSSSTAARSRSLSLDQHSSSQSLTLDQHSNRGGNSYQPITTSSSSTLEHHTGGTCFPTISASTPLEQHDATVYHPIVNPSSYHTSSSSSGAGPTFHPITSDSLFPTVHHAQPQENGGTHAHQLTRAIPPRAMYPGGSTNEQLPPAPLSVATAAAYDNAHSSYHKPAYQPYDDPPPPYKPFYLAPTTASREDGGGEADAAERIRHACADSKVLGNPNATLLAKGAYLVSTSGLKKRSLSVVLPSGRKMILLNYYREEDKDKFQPITEIFAGLVVCDMLMNQKFRKPIYRTFKPAAAHGISNQKPPTKTATAREKRSHRGSSAGSEPSGKRSRRTRRASPVPADPADDVIPADVMSLQLGGTPYPPATVPPPVEFSWMVQEANILLSLRKDDHLAAGAAAGGDVLAAAGDPFGDVGVAEE
ncbi:MAG: hypothetical protein SGCHY_005597 [Lobulomycetales sp.]